MKTELKLDVKKRRQERIKQLFREPQRITAQQEWNYPKDEQAWKEWRKAPTGKQFLLRLAICTFIYAAAWGATVIQHPFADRIESQITKYLTAAYNFHAAADWYEKNFGGWPAFIPAFNRNEKSDAAHSYNVPVSGHIVSPYSVTRHGIWLSTKPNQIVSAIGAGLVESVRSSPDTGLTVVVQHAEGLRSIYGFLERSSVEPRDWLNNGAVIGIVKADQADGAGKLYFAMMQDTSFIDPGDVIPFD